MVMAEKPYPSPEPSNTRHNAPFYVGTSADISADVDAGITASQEQAEDIKQAEQHQELIARLSQSLQQNNADAQATNDAQVDNFLTQHHANIAAAHLAHDAQTALGLSRDSSGSPFQALGDHRLQSDTPDTSAIAKGRSKVSRACDDCRRKKIKCDATTERGVTTCTSCRKAGAQCIFARQPQKRGPSKGYIKELADRVTSLEGQLKHNVNDDFETVTSQDDGNFMAESLFSGGAGTKRTHSMLESLSEHYNATTRNGFSSQLDFRYDEGLAALYYQLIHPYLPFLPSGGSPSLRQLIMNIPFATKMSLLAALDCTLRAPPYASDSANPSTAHSKADEISRAALYADPVGLPHLQSLLLLAIDSANRGALVIQGGHGPRPGNYIAQAMEEAKTLDLFNYNVIQRSMDEDALSLARSIAMSVSVLDVVTTLANKKVGSKPVFPSSITMSGDLNRVGTRLYWFGRAIHRLVDLSTMDVEPREGNEGRINDQRSSMNAMKKIFMTSLEEYKETSGMDKDSLLGLAFWYVWGHMELYFWPLMESSNLFYAIKSIIELLEAEQYVTPFTHHFTGFTSHMLFQLAEFSDTREQAFALLAQLDEVLNRLVSQSNTQSFDAAIRDSVSRRRSMIGETERAASPAMGLDTDGAVNGSMNGDQEEMHASPADDGGVAAAAAAAAKAVQLHMGSAALKSFAPDMVSQEGYLYALLG